ncbi:hypothetical protein JM93_00402 [Roseibium hamelinense]|uniref:Phosphatidate cytidylyltransferase n=1 Tax=Roseibium hamelinense TaxID=150831 RepID=A0A562TJE3_9HYPH|nr:UDP-2,3-diacylglucosamine diphosphatase LpxI [Roseibium hamelinense]MTI45961.1 DUF1009 domain-containing protein [Roseibium hamelinense]TWI92850.1 hypothetical protein JM93_00402 [Roseibium hamelinense]
MFGGSEPENQVALIAGNGALPRQVAEVLTGRGDTPLIVGIKGEIDAEMAEKADAVLGWGEIGRLFNLLTKRRCRKVLLIGGVRGRPDYTSVLGDIGTLKRLPRIIKALRGGDDSLLTKVIGLFEVEGFQVVGIHDVAPELLAKGGVLGKIKPDEIAMADLDLALQATDRLGELDIGQAAVAMGGRVIALEGAEGTDLMLQRCADMRKTGRIRQKGKIGVLVKSAKPGQDLRVDLPTIGPKTVELVVEAGLAGIAVDAGGALISEHQATVEAADRNGIFLFGIERAQHGKSTP